MTVSQVVPNQASAPTTQPPTTTCANMAKVVADIRFLQDRIAAVKGQRSPNRAVLETYTTMLARRELALKLLQDSAGAEAQLLDSVG